MSGSPTKKKIKCAACKKRIREHQPDLEVLEVSTGKVRYFHEWCGGAAYAKAKTRGGAWLATHRYVDPERN